MHHYGVSKGGEFMSFWSWIGLPDKKNIQTLQNEINSLKEENKAYSEMNNQLIRLVGDINKKCDVLSDVLSENRALVNDYIYNNNSNLDKLNTDYQELSKHALRVISSIHALEQQLQESTNTLNKINTNISDINEIQNELKSLTEYVNYLWSATKALWVDSLISDFDDSIDFETNKKVHSERQADKSRNDFNRQQLLGAEYKETDISVDIAQHKLDKLNKISQLTADETIIRRLDQIATTQEELDELIQSGVKEIYLASGEFNISDVHTDIKYFSIDPSNVIKLVNFDCYSVDESNIALTTNLAEIGSSDAQYQLGEYYYFNDNKDDALKWMKKASESGNMKALDWLYDNKHNSEEQYGKATDNKNRCFSFSMEDLLKAAEEASTKEYNV